MGAEAVSESEAGGSVEEGFDPERVLLVEDDPDTAKLLERTLQSIGREVEWARDGQEAILVTQNNPPALVVMDVMMPRLDGFETTRFLKVSTAAYLPVMIVTARDDAESVARAQTVAADDYMTKPVRRQTLLAAVQLLAELRSAESARDTARIVGLRLRLAERLLERGIAGVARVHLERLQALAPESAEVQALARRLSA